MYSNYTQLPGKFIGLLLFLLIGFSSGAQTVLFQSGFEPADPAFLYRSGPTNTPVQSTTGGNAGPYCGRFNTNGKYDGAFVTGTTLSFTNGKFYTINFVYRVATCVGQLRVYRSTTAGTYANITAGTLLSTITTNQVAYTATSVSFQATATQNAFIGFVSTMTANGCNSANFWLDDVVITEYDTPPCTFYCPQGGTTSGSRYISDVLFNTISRSSGFDGYVCTGLITTVERTVSYDLTVITPTSGSTYYSAAWIDWNADGDYNDAGENVMASAIHPATTRIQSITIPAGAVLGITKMRVKTKYNAAITGPCEAPLANDDVEDYDIEIAPAPVPMTYVSCTATQNNTNPVNAGTYQNEILGVQIVTNGTLSPLSATTFNFTTTGTTSPVNDLLNAQLWSSGTNSNFSTATQVGTIVANPNGSFSFNGSVTLEQGTNYFWITYDIKSSATSPDVADATFSSVVVGGISRTPTVSAPAGNRPIITATPMVYVSGTTTQNVSRSPRPDVNHHILGVEIVTSGAGSPLSATSFSFNTTGTSAIVTNNIANARLWFTGTSNVFATGTQVGGTIAAPNGVFTITPSVTLYNGTNYFWLTYDIPATAGCDPVQADAQCTGYTVGGIARTPTVTAPLGAVVIDCNTAYFSKGSLPANLPSSWNTMRDGSGTDATAFGAGSIFYVQNGHIMTTSAAVTIPFLTVEQGGRVNATFLVSCTDLRINGYGIFEQIVQAANGNYITNFFIENNGTWIHNNAGFLPSVNRYFSPRSNQWFYKWGGGTFPSGTSWGNVLLNGTTPGNFGMGYVLTDIQGDFEWRRIGNNNYLMDEANETINIGGNLIFSGGWWRVAYDNSVPGNQTRTVVINVAGDFIMTSGKLEDYLRGNASSGTTLNVSGNVNITGGTLDFNLSPGGASPINLVVGNPASTWSQTGGTVTLGNTNIKTGKTLTMTGSKMGDVAASRTLTVETGAKLYMSNFPATGAGNFMLSSGAHIGIGSAAGIVSAGATGNVQVGGTRTYTSNATYEYYEGLTPQSTGNFITTTTSGTYPSQVANLIINKTSPSNLVNLTNTTDVTSTLTLTSGIVNTSLTSATAPWIRIPSTGTVTPAGGSANSYVDGFIRRQGNTAFTFPTGNAGKWRRVAITAPSVSTELEARYVTTPYSNTTTMSASPIIALDHVSKIEHWLVQKPLGADGATTNVQLFWEDASQSVIYKFDSLAVGRWSGSGWENANCYGTCPPSWTSSTAQRTYTGLASGSNAGTIQSNTLPSTAFGPFTVSSIGIWALNPLPVSLLSFDADCKSGQSILTWLTASETNCNYFTIYRSGNGRDFTRLESVKAAGNSTHVNEYAYKDKNPLPGINYYRLSQTDFDGTETQLRTVATRCQSQNQAGITAFNNQKGQIELNFESAVSGICVVVITDDTGRQIHTSECKMGAGSAYIDISGWASGVYTVEVKGAGFSFVKKIMVN
jgi:hypothetical protein